MKTFKRPLDIVRVTSSALLKIEKHPHSWTFTSTPPLDIARVTSSTFQGGGDRSRSRTLCIGFQYRDKFKGGGGVITHVPPPPGSATGVHLRSTSKKGGSNFGPNVKKPTSWPKGGGVRTPWTPPPGPATVGVCVCVRLWCVCMYVCMYVCKCMYSTTHTTHLHTTCICMLHSCMYVCVYVCMYVCMYVSCMYVCMYVYIC